MECGLWISGEGRMNHVDVDGSIGGWRAECGGEGLWGSDVGK